MFDVGDGRQIKCVTQDLGEMLPCTAPYYCYLVLLPKYCCATCHPSTAAHALLPRQIWLSVTCGSGEERHELSTNEGSAYLATQYARTSTNQVYASGRT